MYKAVLDTTVLVAAMLRPEPGGVSIELLRRAAEGEYELYLSDDILEETAATLMGSERNRRRYKYSDENIVEYCEWLAHIGAVISDIPLLTGVVRDPNDDMIVACAVAANADFLVSRDKDLLTLGSYNAIDMMTPEAFLGILRKETLP
jgi:putative PIN family toxin of toxin-antitoxin system